MPRGKKKVEDAVVESKPAEETPKVAADVAPAVETPKDEDKESAFEKFKAAVAMDPTMQEQLITLGKGTLIAATDAALVHLSENVSSVELGRYTGLVNALTTIAIRELRNILHGNPVSDEVKLEAMDVKGLVESDEPKEETKVEDEKVEESKPEETEEKKEGE